MNAKELDDMAGAIVDVIKKAVDPLKARNAELDARVKELESRPLLKYAGVWQVGETYSEGRLVTHAGSLWLATETTTGQPGIAASGFRLIVKRGQA